MSLRDIPRRLWPATYDDWKSRDPNDDGPSTHHVHHRERTDKRPLDERLAEMRDPKHREAWDAFFARIEAQDAERKK